MDPEITRTLEETENQLSLLRSLIAAKEGAADPRQTTAGSTEPPAISAEQQVYTKYMTYSTVKLFETQGLEVFRVQDSVGLYFIVPGSPVRTAARSALLRVVRLPDETKDDSHPAAFLQVGDWIYPLMPGSTAYRSEHKYYLFPDLLSTTPGTSVGVVLPKSCPPDQRQLFENIILGLIEESEFPPHPPEAYGKSTELILSAKTSVSLIKTSSGVYSTRSNQNQGSDEQGYYGKRIGAGIKAGGQLISRGVELGAIGTAHVLALGTTCLKTAMTKQEQDQGIPSLVTGGIISAKDVTGRVVDISSSILTTLSSITSNFTSLTACYIRANAAPLIEQIIERSGIPRETLELISAEVRDLGHGIVGGTMAVCAGLDNAGHILANSLNANTVEILTHCYGPSAARVIQDAGEVVGNVTITGIQTGQIMKPKQLLCRAVRQTGVALAVEDCN